LLTLALGVHIRDHFAMLLSVGAPRTLSVALRSR
jgi:hypothetical protein